HTHSGKLASAVGSSTPLPAVRRLVNQTAGASGNRVTLLTGNVAQGSVQLSKQADSGMAQGPDLSFRIARTAALQRRLVTGFERSGSGAVAEAGKAVFY